MKADEQRKSGFYWVRFKGSETVAEYAKYSGDACQIGSSHWHIIGSNRCYRNGDVSKLLFGPIPTPKELEEARATLGAAVNKAIAELVKTGAPS